MFLNPMLVVSLALGHHLRRVVGVTMEQQIVILWADVVLVLHVQTN
jgi:hypothetical protein